MVTWISTIDAIPYWMLLHRLVVDSLRESFDRKHRTWRKIEFTRRAERNLSKKAPSALGCRRGMQILYRLGWNDSDCNAVHEEEFRAVNRAAVTGNTDRDVA